MNIPPYWSKQSFTDTDARGRQQTFSASGWSFESLEEAKKDALERAKRIFEIVTSGRKVKEYEYFDRPIREEIVKTVDIGSEHPVQITRNRYGAVVLNTSDVLFADVDCPPAKPSGLLERLQWMFSPAKKKIKDEAVRQEILLRIKAWSEKNSSNSFRLYRTHSGYRLLFVDHTYKPDSEEVVRILNELDADPLYKKLTRTQNCFRARLTPKPWRCGSSRPPCSFPWGSSSDEQSFRDWEKRYTDSSSGFTTCNLFGDHSPTSENPIIQQVVDLHDNLACSGDDRPLA